MEEINDVEEDSSNSKLLFLIGFMGVGKTTLGKKVARQLAIPFVDTDLLIEQNENRSINTIFKKEGEAYFRELETKILLIISKKYDSGIVSVGGGLPCYNDNIKLLKKWGEIVYLQRPEKELFHRLKNAKTKRPLLSSMSDEELVIYIHNKIEERKPYYTQADIILPREQQTVTVLKKIYNQMKEEV